MQCKIKSIKGTWRDVADAARVTQGLAEGNLEVPSNWKRRILLAEHSPIRKITVNWLWTNLLSWVSVHFVRHKFGIEHWVRSQRTDRTGVNRNELTQAELIEHECEASAQALINMARKRLCVKASPETRQAFIEVKNQLYEYEPELAKVLVPDCVYRGWCYEMQSCGFFKSKKYQNMLNNYRRGINE